MADFLITARITAPDDLLAQATVLASIGPLMAEFEGKMRSLFENSGKSAPKVELQRVRAAKGSAAAANPDKPKRERKKRASGDVSAVDVQTPARSSDLLGHRGTSPNPYEQAQLGEKT